ncbi:hypothetical protein JXA85_05580 [Candidatus Woesearchaeota archaeon]|nr:hypothetical protein [Candidatus Woesearchaeota archaeon]
MQGTDMNPFQPQQQQKAGGGIFKKEDKALAIDPVQISNELNNVSRRVRIMEERYINLRRKTQVTDQNMLLNNRKLSTEIKMVADDVKEVKRELADIQTKMKLIVKELKECAKKEEMIVVQKYIDMWEPINFVTRNEVEKMVKEIIDSTVAKQN